MPEASSPQDAITPSINALVDCLEAEYRALLAEDAQLLEAALKSKAALIERLAGQADTRTAAAALPGRLALERLRQLNQRNAQVLAPRALANRARLRFLQAALGRAPALYSADGSY